MHGKRLRGSMKGYLWDIVAPHLKLAYFFYDNGSRSQEVILESEADWFAESASLKLSDGTMSATETVKSATITLDNIDVAAKGVLTVWFAMLPTSALNGQTLSIKLCGASSDCEGSVSDAGNIVDGNAYSYACTLSETCVDLGIYVKWATCNLGASSPEQYGGYYQWAGTEDVTSTSIYLDFSNCPHHTGSDESTGWKKYNTQSSFGTVDNKYVLDPEDDAAHVALGG